MGYDELKLLYHEVIEGFLSASRGEFPPHNPHAPHGLEPGDSSQNPRAAAWSYGYHSYLKHKSDLGDFQRGPSS